MLRKESCILFQLLVNCLEKSEFNSGLFYKLSSIHGETRILVGDNVWANFSTFSTTVNQLNGVIF